MQKIALLLITTLSFFLKGISQIKAVTETGEEVILNQDGSWRYSKAFDNTDSVKTNTGIYKKSINSTFLLKSQKSNLGFWIDPKKWNFKKGTSGSDAEFQLDLKGQSLQSSIITEAAEIPLESFVSIAVQNGRAAAPDLHIINKEYRTVNNLKVLFLQMAGTQSGIKFTYSGYYYSKPDLSVQYVTYTYTSMMQKYSKDIQELLNGLVEIKSNESASTASPTAPIVEKEVITGGSFSSNINCKQYFPGIWKTSMIDAEDLKSKTMTIERTLTKSIEYTQNKKYYFEYEVKWIDNCRYDLILRKTTKPNYKLVKIDEAMTVEITFLDDKVMKYTALFRGQSVDGELTKS